MSIEHRGTEPEGIAIGDELGIRYDGIQEGLAMQFTDVEQTGTTFYADTLEEARTHLAEKRDLFAKSRLVSIVEMDGKYTLKELRDMCREAGLGLSGAKKELAAKLLAAGRVR